LARSFWLCLLASFLFPALNTSAQTAAQTAGPVNPVPNQQPFSEAPVGSVPDPGIIPTRQILAPAGVQAVFESRVYGVTFGSSSDLVYVLTTSRNGAVVSKLDWKSNRALESIELAGYPAMQGIVFDTVKQVPLVTALNNVTEGAEKGEFAQVVSASGEAHTIASHLGKNAAGGLALSASPDARLGVVPLTYDDAAAVIDLNSGAVKATVKTGVAPFAAVVTAAGTIAYVSNWGGRFPREGDTVAATGSEDNSDKAVVDARGIASTGTVTEIDLAKGSVVRDFAVGLHPTGLALDETHHRLFVANSNTDSISVIDTARKQVVRTIAIEPFERRVVGVSPESLALSKNGETLYVACAGINAIAVLQVPSDSAQARVEGLIPTGWYPAHIALSPDGNYVAVSTILGVGSGWKHAPVDSYAKRFGLHLELGPTRRYVHSYRGTVHVIPIPEANQLARYSAVVAESNHLALKGNGTLEETKKSAHADPLPVPLKAGDPSPIQHIVYIIKENRSYDQMFGDLGKGNGDSSLEVYGEDVEPNQRALARQFVLLDNFFATGGNSGDGHQWVTQANETDYTIWPGYGGRSYPKNGDDPMAYSNSGFLWDNALRHGKTFADFGEYAGFIPKMKLMERMKLFEEYEAGSDFAGQFHTVAPIAPLNKSVVQDYPAYGLQVPDVVRARIFIRHLKQWETTGEMPNLVMMQLPSDHTAGTTPGLSTPKAEIADNDLAVGQVAEGISHSKFWNSTLILVVEDDAQDGLDHVDGHRTIALAISPYIRHGAIDSTFYSQPSMIKTIELILGLPTMTLFDLIANDMRNSFQSTPDLAPFEAIEPKQSIYEANPTLASLNGTARQDAIASMHMNWLIPDAAPTEELNRVLWRSAKGHQAKYPAGTHALFQPYAGDTEKKDKD
jgi:YVTN family beta-propeller protein